MRAISAIECGRPSRPGQCAKGIVGLTDNLIKDAYHILVLSAKARKTMHRKFILIESRQAMTSNHAEQARRARWWMRSPAGPMMLSSAARGEVLRHRPAGRHACPDLC